MKTILIPDHVCDDIKIEQDIFGKNYRIHLHKHSLNRRIKDEHLRKCDAMLVWHHMDINEKIIEKLDNCKIIVRVGVGFDNVDLELTKKHEMELR